MSTLSQALINGVALGGMYLILVLGFSIIWGVMGVINFAHGEFVMVGAYLFGGVMVAQLFVQGSGLDINIPAQFLSALPYLATIIVLVVISRDQNTVRLNAPVSVGQPYRPEG